MRLGNIDSRIIDNQLIAFNLLDFIQSDDVGTMHPHEIVFWQFFFEFFERHQSENRPLFCGKINLHIILQTFDLEDVFLKLYFIHGGIAVRLRTVGRK